MRPFKDVFGAEIGVGSWVAYPGAQGSSRAYLSVGLVVDLKQEAHTHNQLIRVRPYGRIAGSVLEPFKSLTTRAFWRHIGYSPTVVVPHSAFLDEETRKPMEDFYREVLKEKAPPAPWWERPEVLDEVIEAQDDQGLWAHVE